MKSSAFVAQSPPATLPGMSWLIFTSVCYKSSIYSLSICETNAFFSLDRDPEAEAEEKVEEKVEEEPPAAEAFPPATEGYPPATDAAVPDWNDAAGGSWGDAQPAGDWGASEAKPTESAW